MHYVGLKSGLRALALSALVTHLASCASGPPPVVEVPPPARHPDPPIKTRYHATVTYTKFGVPHVAADDWSGLGYGYGYAVAEDNLCVMADAFLTFRGERSRYFGPKGLVPKHSTIGNPENLDSDFFFRNLLSAAAVAKFRESQPPEVEELTAGYAAGYSRYVREIRDGAQPGRHAECRNAEWLTGITAIDIHRRMMALLMAAGSLNFISSIANAAPPGAILNASTRGASPPQASSPHAMWPVTLGSNMIGFGSEATENGHGLLFGNPHWYWDGIDRFHQVHLKIPGQVDVEGASILGVPLVLIGFNNDIAWSHTVSTAARFSVYRLKLVNGKPTDYLYDGKPRHLQPKRITVEVRFDDGTIGQATRTLYESHYGPVLAEGWTKSEAFAIRDANRDNARSYRTWLRWNRSRSLDEFMSIQKEEVSIPWVNTIAVGRDGRVWYADVGAIPNVSDARRSTCKVGDRALDGSRSQCEWEVDDAGPQPGLMPERKLPQMVRQDYAANMNDSFWLSNANAPLEGFPSIIGSIKSEQTFRTRLGHILVRERLNGTDGLPGTRANSENVRDIVLNSRSLTAELFLDDVLNTVCKSPSARLPGEPHLIVDIQEGCRVLAAWDRRGNPGSIGAQIWDKIWEALEKIPAAERYRVEFDPAAPIDTPNGLDTESPKIAEAVATGIDALSDTPVQPDAARSEYQYLVDAAGAHIPLAGGCVEQGYFTVVCTELTRKGVSVGDQGNSYMQVVGFTDDGVEPYTLFLPSQSTDPASPHYRDYTRAYSAKSWVRTPFTDEEVNSGSEARRELQE